MRTYLASGLLALIIFSSAPSHAKPFSIEAVGKTQSGLRVVKASNGNFYIELTPNEAHPKAATAQDVYEAYRAEMHELMMSKPQPTYVGASTADTYDADPVLRESLAARERRGVLGISLTSFKLLRGTYTRPADVLERSISELSGAIYIPDVSYDTGKNEDLLLVRTCPRLRQHADVLDDQAFDCHPSLTMLIKFGGGPR